MNPFKVLTACALLSSVAFVSPVSAEVMATTASVTLRAERGNYVGFGLDAAGETWTHGVDGVFRSFTYIGYEASIYFSGDDSWWFSFAAPMYDPATNTVGDRRLQVGRYDNAAATPGRSPVRPGISVSGAGRQSSRVSGWFDVKEVTYNDADEITSLWVDFAQYGETLTQSGPGLFGTLHFQSGAIAAPVPEAATSAQFALGMVAVGLLVTRRRKKSH